MIRLAIFASGSGSNAEQIFKYFKGHSRIEVGLLIGNRKEALVFEKASRHGIPSEYFPGSIFSSQAEVVAEALSEHKIDYLILSGFLLLMPRSIINLYPEQILNIHPALLPDFGGEGMYGKLVHQAVRKSGKNETGISIHLVDYQFDSGKIIFQATCPVFPSDSDSDIAARVLTLEHEHYPFVIEQFVTSGIK